MDVQEQKGRGLHRRIERQSRPSPGVGGPARPRVGHRPQRLPGRWRSPEDHRRSDRSGFDPDLSAGRRAGGGAPAEGPASTPVRVRRLTSSAMGAGEPYGERRPQWSQRGPGWTRYGPTGNQALLRALANDLQTIISELTLPLAWVRRLDKRAQKGPHFSYTLLTPEILCCS